MKEYIERETVVAFLENMAASRYLIQCFESKERFPAADLEPVRRGKWDALLKYSPKLGCSVILGYFCSLCNRDNKEKTNYCPHCGAKMDGGQKNEG